LPGGVQRSFPANLGLALCADGARPDPLAGERIPGGNEIFIPAGDGDPFSL
jgi:hypothetical protein